MNHLILTDKEQNTFNEINQTPKYIYNTEKISHNINIMNDAFSSVPHGLRFAMKSLNNPTVLSHIQTQGIGVECVSVNEVQLAIECGFKKDMIVFTPSNTHFEEYAQVSDLGILVTLDNLSILEKFGRTYKNTRKAMIRWNPHVMGGEKRQLSTGHINSKFGISIDYKEEVLAMVKKYNINIIGVHVHTGSGIGNLDVFKKSLRTVFETSLWLPNINIIDCGSGFKVPYRPNEQGTDLAAIGDIVSSLYAEFSNDWQIEPEIWFEPGKYIVADAGYLATQVTAVKNTPARSFVCVDTGLNHLLRPMMYDAYHHITNITAEQSPEQRTIKTYDIVGNMCEDDNFAVDRSLPETKEGDLLIIHTTGAYGEVMSSGYTMRNLEKAIII